VPSIPLNQICFFGFMQVARLGVPYMMMHMRGNPTTMQLPENKDYKGNVCLGVGTELALAANRAIAAGIQPWRILLDPGEKSISSWTSRTRNLRRNDSHSHET